MANQLDELTGPVNQQGRDVNVIEKQLPVTVGFGSTIFEIVIFLIGFVPALVLTLVGKSETGVLVGAWCAGILPGGIYWILKMQARNFFQQLQQRIQAQASEIDNYLEQRVVILENVAGLVQKATELDKDVMASVAAFRGGCGNLNENSRSEIAGRIDQTFRSLVPHVEAYPELKAHQAIADAMRQNSYLQKEITAARTLYNDTVATWNREVFAWPVKQIVAARAGYTTRIPFSTSSEIKAQARSKMF